MSEVALSIGAGLIAFGPLMALFSNIVYSKAQLVIVVTSSAFFFLLSTVVASLFWTVFHYVGLRGPLAGIVPGVLAQFAFRCWFVAVYHRVEKAIQRTVENHEAEDAQRMPSNETARRDGAESTTGSDGEDKNQWTVVAKLRLELNDASCGIAAGVGFGGMHAVLLYGSLLASEMTNNIGVLYQQSCPTMPSLAVSAVYAFCFSILDIFWMLLTFYGMRRRAMYHRGERPSDNVLREHEGAGAYLGNTREGGNMALLSVLVTHFLVSILTTADYFRFGCIVSLPATGVMVLVVAYWFWAGVGRIFMPPQVDEVANDYNQHDD